MLPGLPRPRLRRHLGAGVTWVWRCSSVEWGLSVSALGKTIQEAFANWHLRYEDRRRRGAAASR